MESLQGRQCLVRGGKDPSVNLTAQPILSHHGCDIQQFRQGPSLSLAGREDLGLN